MSPMSKRCFASNFGVTSTAGRFTMEFAQSGPAALQCVGDAEGVSFILIRASENGAEALLTKPIDFATLSVMRPTSGLSALLDRWCRFLWGHTTHVLASAIGCDVCFASEG
jgi:hypothetical protein